MNPITVHGSLAPQLTPFGTPPADKTGNGDAFGRMLSEAMDSTNRMQQEADTAITELVTGRETDIHRTMIAMEKADVSFQLVMQVRNKLVAAYEEMMRMQV